MSWQDSIEDEDQQNQLIVAMVKDLPSLDVPARALRAKLRITADRNSRQRSPWFPMYCVMPHPGTYDFMNITRISTPF